MYFDTKKAIAGAEAVKQKINTLARDIYLMHHDAEPIGERYDFQKGLTERSRKCWDAAVIVIFNTQPETLAEDDVYVMLSAQRV